MSLLLANNRSQCITVHPTQLSDRVIVMGRHNQELEQDSVAMHEEQRKLEREARSLALRLDAVLKDKFTPRTSFDADTPIDKTLKFLQKVIAVSICLTQNMGRCLYVLLVYKTSAYAQRYHTQPRCSKHMSHQHCR